MTIAHSVDHSYDHVDCAGVSPCNGEGLQCWHQGQGEENCDCKYGFYPRLVIASVMMSGTTVR